MTITISSTEIGAFWMPMMILLNDTWYSMLSSVKICCKLSHVSLDPGHSHKRRFISSFISADWRQKSQKLFSTSLILWSLFLEKMSLCKSLNLNDLIPVAMDMFLANTNGLLEQSPIFCILYLSSIFIHSCEGGSRLFQCETVTFLISVHFLIWKQIKVVINHLKLINIFFPHPRKTSHDCICKDFYFFLPREFTFIK